MREGCRDARGEAGVPRICSAKLPRWPRGSGLEAIFSAGGGERPIDAVELLRDCIGDGVALPSFLFLVSVFSLIVESNRDAGAGWGGKECVAARQSCGFDNAEEQGHGEGEFGNIGRKGIEGGQSATSRCCAQDMEWFEVGSLLMPRPLGRGCRAAVC